MATQWDKVIFSNEETQSGWPGRVPSLLEGFRKYSVPFSRFPTRQHRCPRVSFNEKLVPGAPRT
ncbi:hypothetical protein ANCDUO_00971 [Ancylostoma duodenale]|uniref:Uncharacterized protein n=1 Tax=Ancylostoma duodenale TaxID=51022 RepID=A0A0C2H4D3_9BILA|nr:hypothetical protein ANCDUO_00971 [Ancylostoma duodenale]